MHGCRWSGGGNGGGFTREVASGAREERDVGEVMGGEEAGDVGADHRPGADDKDGTCGRHDEWGLKGVRKVIWKWRGVRL